LNVRSRFKKLRSNEVVNIVLISKNNIPSKKSKNNINPSKKSKNNINFKTNYFYSNNV